jgi:hypothetical protein
MGKAADNEAIKLQASYNNNLAAGGDRGRHNWAVSAARPENNGRQARSVRGRGCDRVYYRRSFRNLMEV